MVEYHKHGGLLYTDCDQIESQQEFYIRCRTNGTSPTKQEELDKKYHIQQRLTTLVNAFNTIKASAISVGVYGQVNGVGILNSRFSCFTQSVIDDNLEELFKLTETRYQL